MSLIRQRLKCRPKIPKWDIVLYCNIRDLCIDAVIAFEIIAFGGEDGNHALSKRIFDDLAHVLAIVIRGAVLLGKYLAYLACTSLVVLPSVMLTYFLTVPFAQVASTFRSLVLDLALLGAGLAVYGAVFAFVGARLKRPLVSGLVFAFGWEQLALALPGYLRQFTVAHHLQSLVPHTMPADSTLSAIQGLFRQTTSVPGALAALGLLLVVFLWLAMRTVARREYVLEQ